MEDWIKYIVFNRESPNTIPKQLEIMLRRLIIGEYVAAGSRLPPAMELSKALKIAYKNVDKAMRALTREGLIDRVPRRGSFVRVRQGKELGVAFQRQVAFFMADSAKQGHPYIRRVIDGARHALEAESVGLKVLGINDYRPAGKLWWEELDKVPGVVGAIVDNNGIIIAEMTRFVESTGLPVVVVNNHASIKLTRLPVIIPRYATGAYEIAKRLLALGHRRIALILGSPTIPSFLTKPDIAKKTGYERALTDEGVDPDERYIAGGDDENRAAITDAIDGFSRLEEPPTAIMCADDLIAFRVIEILKERGVRVPEDISVSGFNDFDFAYACEPKITTVSTPTMEIGALAGEKMLNLLNGGQESNETYLPVTLVERESTGPASPKTNPLRSAARSIVSPTYRCSI